MRSSPASRAGRAARRRSVAPLVVIDEVDAEPGQAARRASGRWARTVGSPPVRRIESKPKRSTHEPGQPLDLLEGEQLGPGQPRPCPSSGMQ